MRSYNHKKKLSESNKKTYQLTPDEVKKERFKKISKKRFGKSTTGKVTWIKVKKIRRLWTEGKTRKQIHQLFPELSIYTINDIIAQRTWKNPVIPNKIKSDF